MIRPCTSEDFEAIWTIINDGAKAYRGVIPEDRWHDPYMTRDELSKELAAGVTFSGFEQDGVLVGVMGIQPRNDVTLIRHAYVRGQAQKQGIGSALLAHLRADSTGAVLIGTWASATWAIDFYQRHGFCVVDPETKTRLLKTYWTVPDRQIETSVVLADERWMAGKELTPWT